MDLYTFIDVHITDRDPKLGSIKLFNFADFLCVVLELVTGRRWGWTFVAIDGNIRFFTN